MTTDYKTTINLPETRFAMKADLARREPAMLADWEAKRRELPPARLEDSLGEG